MGHTYRALLAFHILVGTLSLASFWGAVLATKGSRLHRSCGRAFAVTMGATAVTAVVLCALLLLDPLSARPPAADLALSERAHYVLVLRRIAGGLLEVGLLTGGLLYFGLRALGRRRGLTARRRRVDLAVAAAVVAAGLALLALGTDPRLPHLRGHGGALAILGGLQMRSLLRRQRARSAWLVEHLVGVAGAGAIAHGSLAVNVAGSFTDDVGLMFLPAAPTVLIFALAIARTARRWRRRLDGASPEGGSAVPPLPVTPGLSQV